MKNIFILIMSVLLSIHFVLAQTNINVNIAEAIKYVTQNLQPDHQSQYFSVDILSNDSLYVESTSLQAVHQFDSLLPHIPKKISILPISDADKKPFGIFKVSVSNHRAQPHDYAEMVTQSLMGNTLRILKKVNSLYSLVQTKDNYISFVDNASFISVSKEEKDQWENSQRIIFTQLYGTVYSKNNKKSVPVSDIVAGDQLLLKGKKGKFYEVQYPYGKIGFVLKSESAIYNDWVNKIQTSFEKIYATGLKLYGIPYLWGGTSIKGVDCSGFTKTIFMLNGILLPRDASQQARVGDLLDIYENDTINLSKALKTLLPGDLLFFGRKENNKPDKVTHVAMYIGNGRFIQSSGSVKISDMFPQSPDYDSFHMRQFLSARRILNCRDTHGIVYLH